MERSHCMQLLKSALVLALCVILTISGIGCGASKTVKGGAIGAAVGGAVGAVVGSRSDKTILGAIVGAAIGGTAGALIGRYMDKQAEELRKDLKNAKVERVGEGIKITFESGILFDFDKAELRTEAKREITRLAEVLNKYKDTNILVEGHTDSVGTEDYNKRLSERRASAVVDYATSQNVDDSRFTSVGYGEGQPVASNSTASGRQANRRVDIAIMANERLKDAAESGELQN